MSISEEQSTSTPGWAARKEMSMANIMATIFIYRYKDKKYHSNFPIRPHPLALSITIQWLWFTPFSSGRKQLPEEAFFTYLEIGKSPDAFILFLKNRVRLLGSLKFKS
jgi:hypothetical protein